MKKVIVLIMHGMAPTDFPKAERIELIRLRMKMASMEAKEHYHELDKKVRSWPRTKGNDPFHDASKELAAKLAQVEKCKVILGFLEFCSPSLEEALLLSVKEEPDKVIVITPMLTPGGSHSGKDIPAAIQSIQKENSHISFVYAWPYDMAHVAEFLAEHIERTDKKYEE